MLQRKLFLLLAISALWLSGLGCALTGATAISEKPTPPATADLKAAETQVKSAVQTAASGGRVTLEFSEGQLTSAANQELQKQGENRLRDLQIRLDDGLMYISGQVNQNGFDVPLSLSVRISVDSRGQPKTEIVSGKAGPFSLPQNILDEITAQFDAVLQSQLEASSRSLVVEHIAIDNGMISVTAQLQ